MAGALDRSLGPWDDHKLVQGAYYIVVEGPIGVGKTTLVQRLAERLPCRTVYEVFEENPFLASFYQDRVRYAFQTEMFFLLSRFRQQEAFAQGALFEPYAISDYLFEKSRLFARETLTTYELSLFDEVFRVLARTVPRPDLVVYLRAPLDVLLKRIERRGRPYEANFDAEYLSNLCRVYEAMFARFDYDDTPLVTVDTTDLDFATSRDAVELILRVLHERPKGRVTLGGNGRSLL
jgi:deoxyadenosine/deoxycytidine kinase